MTVTTNTLGSNTAEIVITGPNESFLNVNTAINSFLISHGWTLVPDATLTVTATALNGTTVTTGTTGLVVGMPIKFGTASGNVNTTTTYYVLTIGSGVITISTSNVVQNSGATAYTVSGSNLTGLSITITSQVNGTVGLTGNSTNYGMRGYYAPNLTGADYKYIVVNFMDFTIDTGSAITLASGTVTAGTYSGGSLGSRYFYTLSNQAYRFNAYNNVSFPRDSYFYPNATPTAGIQIPLSPTFLWTYATGNYSSGNFGTVYIPTAAQGYAFYPGQTLVAYNTQYNQYALATVNSYNDSVPTLSINNPFWGTINSNSANGWYLMNYGLNYNQTTAPAYIYISATARHVCIQARNTDGTWFDWTAVCELENPLNLGNNWGLTTGYMISNSGFTLNANNGNGFNGAGGQASTQANFFNINIAAVNLTGNALIRSTPLETSNMNGKYCIFTGPFAVPATNNASAKTGRYASQISKLITPLGEVGYVTTTRKSNFENLQAASSSVAYASSNELAMVFYKGLADLMPTQTSTVGSSKHWAVSCSLITDISTETNVTTFLMNTRSDNIEGLQYWQSTSSYNYTQGGFQSYRDMSQYRAQQPTAMGRLYGLKAVTAGLPPTTTISIKVDASGFTSTSGSATDHFVFSTPSYYISYNTLPYQTAIAPPTAAYNYTSFTITATSTTTITTSGSFGTSAVWMKGTPVTFVGNVSNSGIVVGKVYYTTATLTSGSTFSVTDTYNGSALSWTTTSAQSFTAYFGWLTLETTVENTAIRSSQQASVAFPK